MTVRFSIIIPTCGRPTLRRTVESAVWAGFDPTLDEMLVVCDGLEAHSKAVAATAGLDSFRLFATVKTSHHGLFQVATGTMQAKGTHLLFWNDDDAACPGALSVARERIAAEPDRVHMFRMRVHRQNFPGPLLWKTPRVEIGNFSCQNYVVPNQEGRVGRWGAKRYTDVDYYADFDFLKTTLDARQEKESDIRWHTTVLVDFDLPA